MNLPIIIVLSGPSGCGKSSLIHALREHNKRLKCAVSMTTRPPRSTEVEGQDYYFVSPQVFDQKHTEILESVTRFHHRYATLRSQVDTHLAAHNDVILDVTHEGLQALKQAYPQVPILSLYLFPPSWKVLQHRLKHRGSETQASFQARVAEAQKVMHTACPHYSHWIMNQDLQDTCQACVTLIQATRIHHTHRHHALQAFFPTPSAY